MFWADFDPENMPEGYVLPPDVDPVRGERGHFHPREWGRRHGPAILRYHFPPQPFAVENALLPDGSRGRAQYLFGRDVFRRPLNHHARAWHDGMTVPVRWQWGHLHVTDDDAVFQDDDSLFSPLHMPPELEAIAHDIVGDAELTALVASYGGVAALYVSLTNGRTYVRSPGDVAIGMPNAQAGSLVAHMRGLGETDLDVEFMRDGDKSEFGRQMARVSARLAELGWLEVVRSDEEFRQLRAEVTAALYDPDPVKAKKARTTLTGLDVIEKAFGRRTD